MSTRTAALALALVAGIAPAVVTAPPPEARAPGTGPRTIDAVVAACREAQASGTSGWELVDHATRLVHDAYTTHSMWQLWETPAQSLANGRGWSAQYNGALAEVLRQLGLRVRVVHAARVRGLGWAPWWQAGHTWLRVEHEGHELDVCASRATNTAGHVPFDWMTPVREVHPWTRATVSAALAPVVAVQAWRQLLGSPVPRWLVRGFDEPL